MKSRKTKFIVISATGLASIVGSFVSAESHKPNVSGQDLPVQIVMACVPVEKVKLMTALEARPADTYRIQYGGDAPIGTLPTMSPPPCAAGLVGNATQRATFNSTKELRDFLNTAGL